MKRIQFVCLYVLVFFGFVQSVAATSAEGVIFGTVYANLQGAWVPVDEAVVTVDEISTYTYWNGFYLIVVETDQSYTMRACVEWDGTLYEAVLYDVAPNQEVNLYLEKGTPQSAECIPPPPPDPVDLTIGIPQITNIDDLTWQITTTVTNTSLIDITSPFYVDAWTTFAPAYGYTEVEGLAAESSMVVVFLIESDRPSSSSDSVTVFVDSTDVIVEYDEFNNEATADFNPTASIESVAVYLLAFDNPSYSAGNLAPQLPETLKGIVAATVDRPNKLAVVLADLDQEGDTHIMTVFDGEVTYINGLPTPEATLDTNLHEYDMSDGATLGGFLLWANRQFPADQTNLFVYAHGAPLAPATDLNVLIGNNAARTPIPLPSWIVTHPDMTDMHPVGLLTPHDLQVALDMATSDGRIYDVVDLVHCFSLSIEEVYEIAPYSEMVTGSPNYAYFDAAMAGAAFAAIEPAMDAMTTADTILSTYDSLLPDEGYPRIMAAVETQQIAVVKAVWDMVSEELLIAFDDDPVMTRAKLATAYQNSAKYDTNYCEPDWALTAPDALSDMHDFANELARAFDSESLVNFWASFAVQQLEIAVTSRFVTDGTAHFTDIDNAPYWEFTGLGLALYTDFAGVERDGMRELSWHADYYTRVVSAENPHPYAFINEPNSWGDVFARYWENSDITTRGCVRTFPPVRDEGELSIDELINPQASEVAINAPILPSISLNATGDLGNVIVQFAVTQNGNSVYSDTIGTGRIGTGVHWLKANQTWTPLQTGSYTLTVTVDPDDYVVEQNENDNQLVHVGMISADPPTAIQPDAAITNGQQWVTAQNAPLTLNGNGRSATQLAVNSYQFSQAGDAIAKASITYDASGNSLLLPLAGAISAGTVQLHVWEVTNGTRTQLPTALRINYIPANTPIAADEMHCFPFAARVGDQIQMRLNVPTGDDANLFVWYPHSLAAPDLIGTRVGDDDMRIAAAPLSGDYLLCVRGVSATTYTLSVIENGPALFTHPTTPENSNVATVPMIRPHHAQPVPQSSRAPTAIALTTGTVAAPLTWLPLMTLAVAGTTILLRCAKRRQWNKG